MDRRNVFRHGQGGRGFTTAISAQLARGVLLCDFYSLWFLLNGENNHRSLHTSVWYHLWKKAVDGETKTLVRHEQSCDIFASDSVQGCAAFWSAPGVFRNVESQILSRLRARVRERERDDYGVRAVRRRRFRFRASASDERTVLRGHLFVRGGRAARLVVPECVAATLGKVERLRARHRRWFRGDALQQKWLNQRPNR